MTVRVLNNTTILNEMQNEPPPETYVPKFHALLNGIPSHVNPIRTNTPAKPV